MSNKAALPANTLLFSTVVENPTFVGCVTDLHLQLRFYTIMFSFEMNWIEKESVETE